MSIKTITYNKETDVLVIGGGLAGLCAAIEAANAGAEVTLLEKLNECGGSSVLSGGLLAFSGTDMQKAAGINDSDEQLYDDIRRAGGQQNVEALVRTYVAHQLSAYTWLKNLGTQFISVELGAGQGQPRAHSLRSIDFMALMEQRARETGKVKIIFGAAAERLHRVDGRVEGVAARINGKPTHIRARRGVVLAAGGFSRNAEMVNLFVPHQAKCVYRGAILVNKQAQRYVDESKSYKLLGDAVLTQTDATSFQIFDQGVMDTSSDTAPLFKFKEALALGRLLSEPTLAALAKRIGVDAATLSATVERYNGFVRVGKDDDFGRVGLSTSYGKLVELKRGPWYAYPSTSGLIATYCGLTVDTEARVIDVFGEAIDGLYAVGEMTGGFHGVAYMTGSSLGKCVIFGRIAGRNAAAC